MRVVMIAHAAFLILAAYLTWFFHEQTGLDPLFSLVITVPLFFGVGVLVQRLLVARLKPATLTMMSVLLTFAIALTIEGLLGFFFSGTSITLLGASIPVVKLIAFGLAAVSLLGLYLLLKVTRFGQSLRATIQHKEAAQLLGIDTTKVAGFGFGLGLATAAIGGAALSLDTTIYPSLHWNWIGPLMAIIVIGGLGSIPGAAIAAMVLGVSQSLLQLPLGQTLSLIHISEP